MMVSVLQIENLLQFNSKVLTIYVHMGILFHFYNLCIIPVGFATYWSWHSLFLFHSNWHPIQEQYLYSG